MPLDLEQPSRWRAGEADDGPRTRDLELGKLALYQLSYVREAGAILAAAGGPAGISALPFGSA
jgi:hypothetical protein